MRRLAICIILSAAIVLAGDKKTGSSEDKQRCLDKCTKTYENCMKTAQTKNAKQSCEGSRSGCRGGCNK